MRTIQQQTAADATTAPDPASLVLPAPRATRQQVFWHILVQSLLYGVTGSLFFLIVLWIRLILSDGFSSLGSGFSIILSLIITALFGGISGVALGLIGALLTSILLYPMRSYRLYQALMWLLPLAVSIVAIQQSMNGLFLIGMDTFEFLVQSVFSLSTLYLFWATQRITTSAIRTVGVVELPYYRPVPYVLDPYLPEGRRALFDMAPEIADRMEYLAGLGMLARWRGALLTRLDLRPGMRAVDLMAGTGALSRALVRRVGAGKVTVVEFAPGVAARLRRVVGVDVVEADALANGLPSGCADVVTCAFGTLGLRQAEQMRLADEVDRLLAPNGVVGLVDLTLPYNSALRWGYLVYLRSAVPLMARLFLERPALYEQLHHYARESVGLGPLAYEFESRGYTVALAPLDGGLATALVAMKQEEGPTP